MLTNITKQVLQLQQEFSELQELTRSPICFQKTFSQDLPSQISTNGTTSSEQFPYAHKEPDFLTFQTNNISGENQAQNTTPPRESIENPKKCASPE